MSPGPRQPIRTFVTGESLSSPSHHDVADFYSLEHLQRRVATYVKGGGGGGGDAHPRGKICLVIAGGGGHLLSALAATPGASSILLEGTVPYSREAFRDYVLSANRYCNSSPSTSESALQLLDGDTSDSFKFCSAQAAQSLAEAACRRALHLSSTNAAILSVADDSDATNWAAVLRSMSSSHGAAAGVACTSVLQSAGNSRSHQTHGSRAYCAVQIATGLLVQLQVRLAATAGRTRFEEDVFVGHCILTCLELMIASSTTTTYDELWIPGVLMEEQKRTSDDARNGGTGVVIVNGRTAEGDELQVTIPRCPPETDADSVDTVLREAAERILSGRNEVVQILPASSSSSCFEVLHAARLPPNSLVVPGSFNPPHAGHTALAKAAAESISNCSAVWFELSITNVDKPALEVEQIAHRLKHFLSLQDEMPNDFCWGILLTNAPLFKQKVELLAPLQIGNTSLLHFSIGTDTLVRLIEPKYYNDSEDEMLRVLTGMPCHFVVGGRLDQRKPSESVFLSGEEVIRHLPSALRSKFTILPDFRVDLSSTEIRQKMAAEQQAKQQDLAGG